MNQHPEVEHLVLRAQRRSSEAAVGRPNRGVQPWRHGFPFPAPPWSSLGES